MNNMMHSPYQRIANRLNGFIVLSIIYNAILLSFRIYSIIIYKMIETSKDAYTFHANIIAVFYKWIESISIVYGLLFLIILSAWLFVKYNDAHNKSRLKLRFNPKWALASFVLPVFNLFAPYIMMNEIWKVNNLYLSREELGKKLINEWWILFIVLVGMGRLFQSAKIIDIHSYINYQCIYLLYHIGYIHFFLLFRRLVSLIEN